MDNDRQVNPVLVAGGGLALLAGLKLRKKRKARKAAKRAAKAEAAVQEPEKKRKKAKAGKPALLDMKELEKGITEPSDHLLRDVALMAGKYKLKPKKKRTRPLPLLILLYLVEQIYREWERQGQPAAVDSSTADGKKKRRQKK